MDLSHRTPPRMTVSNWHGCLTISGLRKGKKWENGHGKRNSLVRLIHHYIQGSYRNHNQIIPTTKTKILYLSYYLPQNGFCCIHRTLQMSHLRGIRDLCIIWRRQEVVKIQNKSEWCFEWILRLSAQTGLVIPKEFSQCRLQPHIPGHPGHLGSRYQISTICTGEQLHRGWLHSHLWEEPGISLQ